MNPRLIPDAAGCGKERLLASLRSPGKLRYRRYNGSPLRYAGGKSLAVGYIVEQLPAGLERLVSPFSGGASVEIAVAKEWGIPALGYDVFDALTNYWQVQLAMPERLAERIAQWEPNKAVYAEVKERLKGHWLGTAPITDRLELAAHYWFNHNLSYGPGFLGWMSRIYEEPERARRLVERARTFRCPNLTVDCGSFEETLPRHRGIFFTATRRIIWMGTVGCSGAFIRSATFRCIIGALTTLCCGICCGSIGAGLCFPITIARRYGSGMGTAALWKWSGNIRWDRGKRGLGRIGWSGGMTAM